MTPFPRYARLAARAIAGEDVSAVSGADGARLRAADATSRAIRERARRRRSRWVTGVLTAAAVITAAVGGASLLSRGSPGATAEAPPRPPAPFITAAAHGEVRVEHSGHTAFASTDTPVVGGDLVLTADGATASLSITTGTRLLLREHAKLSVTLDGPEERFDLAEGALRADVAKLHEGERFVVGTPDAEVEVRGTSFVVETFATSLCEDGPRTRVTVREGVVLVRWHRAESRVAAGQTWPTSCTSPARPAAEGAPMAGPSSLPAASAAPPPLPLRPPAAASPASPLASPASDLQYQNALFAAAIAAKRRGDTAGALREIDQMLSRYPSSPLAENAKVERMRMQSGHAAVLAARDYLSRYPQGFARSEAEAISDQEP